MAMEGRFHYYEGYDMKAVTFPERVMYELGIETLFVSNASGGMNPEFQIGDLMIIDDHINFFPEHPLRGKNFPTGPRFPDMHEAYDKKLRDLADDIAKEKGIDAKHGVYVGVQGPTFETPAEYNWIRVIGGDAVGMSTVPEVIVARHMNMECFGMSVITNSTASAPPVMPKARNRNCANLHFISVDLLYQPMLSSKSSSDGSTGSSCMTLIMYSLTVRRASAGETMR